MASIPRVTITATESNLKTLAFPKRFWPNLLDKDGPIRIRRIDSFRVWAASLTNFQHYDGSWSYLILGGWKAFVADNDIRVSDMMIFEFPGNQVFTFRLYDAAGLKKTINPGPNPYLVGGRMNPLDAAYCEIEAATGADTYMAYSPYPAFKVLMNSQYISTGYVNIPKYFAAEHMFPGAAIPTAARIKLCAPHASNPIERTVNFKGYFDKEGKCYNCKISGGYPEFAASALISVGHLVTFELTGGQPDLQFRVVSFAKLS